MLYCPIFPSRFGALYVFGDLDTCRKGSKKYGWNVREIKKFKLFLNMQNARQLVGIVKYNMVIVSFMRAISYEINNTKLLNKL